MKSRMFGSGFGIALLAGSALVAAMSSARLAQGAGDQPAATSITIDNFSFAPKEITIAKGTTVTWVNHDDVPHTVVGADKKFKSKALDTDDTFSFTFTHAGTYGYFCSVHPIMTGKVIVR